MCSDVWVLLHDFMKGVVSREVTDLAGLEREFVVEVEMEDLEVVRRSEEVGMKVVVSHLESGRVDLQAVTKMSVKNSRYLLYFKIDQSIVQFSYLPTSLRVGVAVEILNSSPSQIIYLNKSKRIATDKDLLVSVIDFIPILSHYPNKVFKFDALAEKVEITLLLAHPVVLSNTAELK